MMCEWRLMHFNMLVAEICPIMFVFGGGYSMVCDLGKLIHFITIAEIIVSG